MLQMPVWWAFFSSYDQSIGDYWVLQDDSDAGSDVESFRCSISFLYTLQKGPTASQSCLEFDGTFSE